MENQVDVNPRAALRRAIKNYFVAKFADETEFMPDAVHRDIVSIVDSVCTDFEDNIDNGVISLSL